jgi:hypothetical protein
VLSVLAAVVVVWGLSRERAPSTPREELAGTDLATDAGAEAHVDSVTVAPSPTTAHDAPASELEDLAVVVVDEVTGVALPAARVVWVEDVGRRPEGEALLDAWTADEHGAVTVKVEARGVLLATSPAPSAIGPAWCCSTTSSSTSPPMAACSSRRGCRTKRSG